MANDKTVSEARDWAQSKLDAGSLSHAEFVLLSALMEPFERFRRYKANFKPGLGYKGIKYKRIEE